jgi:hypothetical protein
MKLDLRSARTGPSQTPKNIQYVSVTYADVRELRAAPAIAFSAPGRQDLPFAACKSGWRDCLPGIRPILESSFSAVSD